MRSQRSCGLCLKLFPLEILIDYLFPGKGIKQNATIYCTFNYESQNQLSLTEVLTNHVVR